MGRKTTCICYDTRVRERREGLGREGGREGGKSVWEECEEFSESY